jgi:hypothetical protein
MSCYQASQKTRFPFFYFRANPSRKPPTSFDDPCMELMLLLSLLALIIWLVASDGTSTRSGD